jgi:superfamily I DNA and/or RNA helicase
LIFVTLPIWIWPLPTAGLKNKAQGSGWQLVDEAAQMFLANVLAGSHARKSIILLGDPQQLDQPVKGSHPEGVDLSALDYILGQNQTISANKGLFLEETWRLHPRICAFTSDLFYD